MRSMWKGAISFGLVMIPVKLYTATEQRDVTFRQVHREDGGRIRFRRVCELDGQEVPYADVAKGYELPDGETVVLTDEDFDDLPLPSTRSIEVLNFTPVEQVDPILYGRSYYIEPDPAGLRAYVLLRDALERSGKVALARVALRQRESLAALRSRDGVLVLETLLWPDEVRAADFPFLDQDVEVRSQELKMAASLIDSMTGTSIRRSTTTTTARPWRSWSRPRSRAARWSRAPSRSRSTPPPTWSTCSRPAWPRPRASPASPPPA